MPSPEWEVGGHCLWWQDPAGDLGKEVARGGAGVSELALSRRPEGVTLRLMTLWLPREAASIPACFGSIRCRRPRAQARTIPVRASPRRASHKQLWGWHVTLTGVCVICPPGLWMECVQSGGAAGLRVSLLPLSFPCPSRQPRNPQGRALITAGTRLRATCHGWAALHG